MKFSIIAMLFLASFFTANAAETTNPGNPKIEASFKNNFPSAHINAWERIGDISVAFFTEAQKDYRAYFDNEGTLIAVARITSLETLPLKVSAAIKNQYGERGDIRVMEVNMQDNATFYLTELVYKNRLCTIKISSDGLIQIVK